MEKDFETLQEAYQKSLKDGTACSEPSAVQSTIDRLSTLKHSGEALKSAFETAASAKASQDVIISASRHHDNTSFSKRGAMAFKKMIQRGLNVVKFWNDE